MTKFASACILVTLAVVSTQIACADEPASASKSTDLNALDHEHKPIVIRSRPVIDRLRLDLIEPVDIAVLSDRSTVIIDRPSGHVFRVLSSGAVTLLARNLKDPASVTCDADDSVFILHGETADREILQIAHDGYRSNRARNLGTSKVIAQSPGGRIFSVESRTATVTMLLPDGTRSEFAILPAEATDLCVDASGQLVALLVDGRIGVVTADGQFVLRARQQQATRLAAHPDGRIIVVDQADTALRIAESPAGETAVLPLFANVPRGTAAAAFDEHGNLIIANVNMRAVTRVTSNLRIPCPHCSQPVPLVLDPHHNEPGDEIRF